MDLSVKEKRKKGLINKTWQRCRSFGGIGAKGSPSGTRRTLTEKSKSWPRGASEAESHDETEKGRKKYCRVAPEGCFSIYVGPEKQRFVIKTEYVNHPLFRMLLEEAESEYGYHSDGPLVLPCDVDFFVKVLMEMDGCEESHKGCTFVGIHHHGSYQLLSPPRFVAINK